jgi:hypothetical protein
MEGVRRAFPGPVGLAAWIAVTVPAPLVLYEATHRWEEDQRVGTALAWSLAALPVLAATVAARWSRHAERRGAVTDLLTALAVATAIGALFLAASLAFYRWVIPLGGGTGWTGAWWLTLPLAAAGATVGHLAGRRVPGPPASAVGRAPGLAGSEPRSAATRPDGAGRPGPPASEASAVGRALARGPRRVRPGYRLGAVIAVAGAVLAPVTVRLGAEDSTIRYDEGSYGGVGAAATAPGVLTLPAAGRYAILGVGDAPRKPDCRIGPAGGRAKLVGIPPRDYGGDFATYAWVASFSVPAPGRYTMECRTRDAQAGYTVGEVPQIRGAVGSLIHWPPPVIWFLGALPGLWILASAVRLRRSSKPAG